MVKLLGVANANRDSGTPSKDKCNTIHDPDVPRTWSSGQVRERGAKLASGCCQVTFGVLWTVQKLTPTDSPGTNVVMHSEASY